MNIANPSSVYWFAGDVQFNFMHILRYNREQINNYAGAKMTRIGIGIFSQKSYVGMDSAEMSGP